MMQLGQPPPYETWRIALTIASSAVALAASAVTAVVLIRTKTAAFWKDERDAAVAKAERFEKDNKVLTEKVAVLEAQRDLTAVQEGQGAIVRMFEAHMQQEAERFTKLTEAIMQSMTMMKGFQSQMAGVFDAQQQKDAEVVMLLKDIYKNTRE